MKNLLIFLLILLVYSCKTRQDEKESNKFFAINFEELLDNKQITGLSQIASKVEYIQLETNNECVVTGGLAKYFICDSLIFVNNRDHILKFSCDGKFLKRIGNPGRGPGEIIRIRIMSIIPQKQLIVIQNSGDNKLLYYSFNGELIKTVTIPSIYNIKVMDDGRYIAYDKGSSISENYSFRLTNESGDTISVVKNYSNWTNPSGASISFYNPVFEPFYTYNTKYYFKTLYNDTIWVVNGDSIEASYFVNLGKYKLPDEKRIERLTLEQYQSFTDNSQNYYFANVLEAAGKLFLATYSYGDKPPYYHVININGLDENSLYNNNRVSTGIIVNDWDGGVDFWPVTSCNNNQVMMPIDIVKFKEIPELNNSKSTPIKYPEKQKQLENMISGLDISNNPILMIVTLKLEK